jgi:hypothetical protein
MLHDSVTGNFGAMLTMSLVAYFSLSFYVLVIVDGHWLDSAGGRVGFVLMFSVFTGICAHGLRTRFAVASFTAAQERRMADDRGVERAMSALRAGMQRAGEDEPPGGLPAWDAKHPELGTDGGECPACRKPMPPRTKHCKGCDRCVLRFDHECFFMGACIGLHNHRFFLGFLAFAFAGLVLSVSFYLHHAFFLAYNGQLVLLNERIDLSQLAARRHLDLSPLAIQAAFRMPSQMLIVFNMVWSSFLVAFVAMQLVGQVLYIRKNMTFYESIRSNRYRKRLDRRLRRFLRWPADPDAYRGVHQIYEGLPLWRWLLPF